MEGYIKTDLEEIGSEDSNWIRVTQDKVQWQALVNMVRDLMVP
jgi:hypothetical protein